MEPASLEREVAFSVAWYPVTERGRICTCTDRSGMHVHYNRTLETQSNIHHLNPLNCLSGGNIWMTPTNPRHICKLHKFYIHMLMQGKLSGFEDWGTRLTHEVTSAGV